MLRISNSLRIESMPAQDWVLLGLINSLFITINSEDYYLTQIIGGEEFYLQLTV